MLYGTLLEKYISTPNEWSTYWRVVLGVETGYGLQIIRTNVFAKEQIKRVEAISLGDQVQFSGYFEDVPGAKFYKLHTIDSTKFDECEKCFAPLEEPCPGCLKEPTERISGTWELRELELINENFKITLTQGENVLCRYIFPNSPFYKECSGLKVEDLVKLQGWRDEKRHTKLNVLEKIL